jgi:hypothetical protein
MWQIHNFETINIALHNPKGLAQVVKALVLRFAPFEVQGSTPHRCKQSLRATPPGEKSTI